MRRSICVVAVVIVLAACGDDASGEAPPTTSTSTSIVPATTVTTTGTTAPAQPSTVPSTTTTRPPTSTTAPPGRPPPDAPLLQVINPAATSLTADPVLTIIGTTVPGAAVTVDGLALELREDDVNWRTDVELAAGEQLIRVTASLGDDAAETTISVTYDPGLEVRFGFLHGIERGDPGWTIWVDEAMLLTGDEATEYAGEEPVDGYVIVDEEPGVLVGVVTDEHALMVMWEGRDGFPGMQKVAATPGNVLAVFEGTVESPWWLVPEPSPVEVYLSDGLVVQVAQRWFP